MRRFFLALAIRSKETMSNVFSGKFWTIERFVSGFANNAFLITCSRTGKSVIIDTPANPSELIETAARTQVEAILITHGHMDHVEGYQAVNQGMDIPTGIGIGDRPALPSDAPVSLDVSTGVELTVGDIQLKSTHTPGHTPGSTCYLLESADSLAAGELSHVFTGDTLFPGGPGKSSSNAALRQIVESLESHIFALHDSTAVLPGHGEFTTIFDSKQEFEIFNSKPIPDDLFGDVTWS